jgi:hypothetical protein
MIHLWDDEMGTPLCMAPDGNVTRDPDICNCEICLTLWFGISPKDDT